MDARAIVLRMQAQGDHSEAEVRTQLERRGFSSREIEDAVEWGREQAALSDDRAKDATIAKNLRKKKGVLAIEADLERRGLDPGVATDSRAELERARAALAPQRARFTGEPMKAAAWLARQGYEEDVVRRVVEELVGRFDPGGLDE